MGKTEIRHAKAEDFDTIMAIYAHARDFMASTGNPKQWGATGWPPDDLIRQDIHQQRSYVCTDDGRVAAVFYFYHGHDIDPTYRHIEEGSWLGNEEYGVVHRLASDGTIKGAGDICLQWAYRQCGHLRADTHPDNKVMQNVLTRNGFRYCGIIHVEEDNDPRLAYEKL